MHKTGLQLGNLGLADHKVVDVFQPVICSSWLHRESRPTYERVPHEVTSRILFNIHVCLTQTCCAGGLVTLDTCLSTPLLECGAEPRDSLNGKF
jgi:hypothetical protein